MKAVQADAVKASDAAFTHFKTLQEDYDKLREANTRLLASELAATSVVHRFGEAVKGFGPK